MQCMICMFKKGLSNHLERFKMELKNMEDMDINTAQKITIILMIIIIANPLPIFQTTSILKRK